MEMVRCGFDQIASGRLHDVWVRIKKIGLETSHTHLGSGVRVERFQRSGFAFELYLRLVVSFEMTFANY